MKKKGVFWFCARTHHWFEGRNRVTFTTRKISTNDDPEVIKQTVITPFLFPWSPSLVSKKLKVIWFCDCKICQSSHQNVIVYSFVSLSLKVNAKTELAIRYNDISPLENHHCAVAFDIISQVTSLWIHSSLSSQRISLWGIAAPSCELHVTQCSSACDVELSVQTSWSAWG